MSFSADDLIFDNHAVNALTALYGPNEGLIVGCKFRGPIDGTN